MFDTVATVQAASIAAGIDWIVTGGYYAIGDCGGAAYRRVATQPAHAIWIKSADGAFWTFADKILTPEMAGAKGDGQFSEGNPSSWTGTDDTVAFQAAIDAHVYFALADRVSLRKPDAVYRITRGLHAGYGDTFRHCCIEGHGSKSLGPGFRGATILADFSNEHVINSQGGRNNRFSGFQIAGRNFDYNFNAGGGVGMGAVQGIPGVDDTIVATWWDPTLNPNGQSATAPYCAIAIDGRCPPDGVVGHKPAIAYPDVLYPAFSGVTQQYAGCFSSDTTIEDVFYQGLSVGVVTHPSGSDGNGDFTRLIRCGGQYLQWDISISHTQSRNVLIQDHSSGDIFCFITTNQHGKKSGKLGGPIINCAIGQCMKIFDLCSTACAGPIEFINLYSEAQWRIGDIAAATAAETSIIFRSCQFDCGAQNDVRGVPATMLAGANQPINLKMDGGFLNNFARVCPLLFGPSDMLLDGVGLNSQNPPAVGYETAAIRLLAGGLVLDTFGVNYPARASRVKSVFPDGAAWKAYAPVAHYVDKTQLTSASLVDKTLTFTMPVGTTLAVGNVLLDAATGSVFFVSAVAGQVVTAILQNNYKATTGGHYTTMVPFVPNAGNFFAATG